MRYSFKVLAAVAAVVSFGACANTSGTAAPAGQDVAAPVDVVTTPKDVAVTPGQDVAPGTDTGVKPTTDIQTAGTEKSIVDIQKSDPSMKCAKPTGFTTALKGVKVSSAIVVSPVNATTTSAGKKLEGVWVQQKGGGAWTGLYLETDAGATAIGTLKVGDTITAIGDIEEFYCMTQMQPTVVTVETAAAELPAPVTVDIAKLGDAATDADNESYESVLVTVNNVILTNDAALGTDGKPHGEMYLGLVAGTDLLRMGSVFPGVYLSDKNPDGTYTPKWAKGQKFASITGVMQYSFGKFRLLPVNQASIVVAP